jgi:hypothetical protein
MFFQIRMIKVQVEAQDMAAEGILQARRAYRKRCAIDCRPGENVSRRLK